MFQLFKFWKTKPFIFKFYTLTIIILAFKRVDWCVLYRKSLTYVIIFKRRLSDHKLFALKENIKHTWRSRIRFMHMNIIQSTESRRTYRHRCSSGRWDLHQTAVTVWKKNWIWSAQIDIDKRTKSRIILKTLCLYKSWKALAFYKCTAQCTAQLLAFVFSSAFYLGDKVPRCCICWWAR